MYFINFQQQLPFPNEKTTGLHTCTGGFSSECIFMINCFSGLNGFHDWNIPELFNIHSQGILSQDHEISKLPFCDTALGGFFKNLVCSLQGDGLQCLINGKPLMFAQHPSPCGFPIYSIVDGQQGVWIDYRGILMHRTVDTSIQCPANRADILRPLGPKHGPIMPIAPEVDMIQKEAGCHADFCHPVQLILTDRLCVDHDRPQIPMNTRFLYCPFVAANELLTGFIPIAVNIDLPIMLQTDLDLFNYGIVLINREASVILLISLRGNMIRPG